MIDLQFSQAYDNEYKNSNNFSMKKVHPKMNPDKDAKLHQNEMFFLCFKIIATYVNPALYLIFVIVYAILYSF